MSILGNPVLTAALLSGSTFTPAALFTGGVQGVWYDASDFSTMFQDSAGTTPVTAVEQPVGLIRDKSGNGYHASQSTAASRPVLSARVNLLTYTEQFDNAAWTKGNFGVAVAPTVTANAGIAPDGTSTADRAQFSLGGGTTSADLSTLRQSVSTSSTTTYTFSFYAKSTDGVSSYVMSVYGPNNVRNSITVTGAWQLFSFTSTGQNNNHGPVLQGGQVPANANTADILIWGADLRPTNAGVNLPAYQRVVSGIPTTTNPAVTGTADYDTVGFPTYLRFDGVDDSLATGTITPGVDKAQVFAGVRKLSDAASGIVAEFSASSAANVGAFGILAPGGAGGATYGFRTGGTTKILVQTPNSFASPITNVLSCLGDIANDSCILRVNGSVSVSDLITDQGTGNFLSYPLYIGMRAGTTVPINGQLYSLIARFSAANLDAATISKTETWVNSMTKAY